MASPYPQLTDTGLQSPTLQQDYSFLQNNMRLKEGQYQQGVQKAANDYSQILNTPVTGEAMNQLKKQYIQQVQEGLKTVTKTDLSLPKNSTQAESLYAPFWSDDRLLINSGITKIGNSNMQTIQSGLLSKDESERDMYSPYQVEDQQNMLRELAAAGTDYSKISQVQRRTVSPFINITKTLNKAAQDQKLKIEYSTGTGTPYLVSTQGGTQTIPNFRTWAMSQMGPETVGMFQTIGRVKAERAKGAVMQQDPSIQSQDLNSAIGNMAYDMADKSYQHNIANYTTSIAGLTKQINDIEARSPVNKDGKPQPTGNDIQKWMMLKQMKEDHSKYLSNEQYSYETFKANKDIQIASYTIDPQEAFAKQEKDVAVENWATGQAAHVEQDIKANQAYSDAQRISLEYNQLRETHSKNLLEAQHWSNLDINEAEKNKINAAIGKVVRNPDTGVYELVTNTPGAGGTINADNIAPLHLPDAYASYMSKLSDDTKTANSMLWSVSGAAGSLLGMPVTIDGKADKITATDIDKVSGAVQKKFDNADYRYTPDERVSMKKIGNLIGATDYNDVTNMRMALESKLGQEEKNKDGTPNLRSIQIAQNIQNSEEIIQSTLAAHKNIDSLTKAYIISNPAANREIVENGHLVTEHDIARNIPAITIATPGGGTKTLSPVEVAKMRMQDIPITSVGDIVAVNGESVQGAPGVYSSDKGSYSNITYNTTHGPRTLGQLEKDLTSRYGDSNTFSQKYMEAKNKVAANVPGLNDALRGFQTGFNANVESQKPIVDALSNALSIPSNTIFMRPEGGTDKIDEKKLPEIRAILAAGSKYIQDIQIRPYAGTNGGPAAQITFKPYDGTDKSGSPAVTFIEKTPSITVDIDQNTKQPLLQHLIVANNTQYGDMYTGATYSSNQVEKSHNYDYSIEPTDRDPVTGRYRNFVVSGTLGYINPSTGKVEQKPIVDKSGNPIIGSFAKTTPYQAKQIIAKEFVNYMQQNIANYNYYKSKDHNTPTYEEIEQHYNR